MALEHGKSGWFWVWLELANEMGENLGVYSKLIIGNTKLKNISQFKVSRIKNKIPPSKWLINMDHFQAITNAFHRSVVLLSLEEYLSFIPKFSAF